MYSPNTVKNIEKELNRLRKENRRLNKENTELRTERLCMICTDNTLLLTIWENREDLDGIPEEDLVTVTYRKLEAFTNKYEDHKPHCSCPSDLH
jgi:hypothetical protein